MKPFAFVSLIALLTMVAVDDADAAIVIDAYPVAPKFETSANATGVVGGETVNEKAASSRESKLGFTSTNVADFAAAPGQSSTTGNAQLTGQIAWSKPDSNQLFVQIDATATAHATASCAADCTILAPLADALGQVAFQFHTDEVLAYTLSYDVSNFSALASGPGADSRGGAALSLTPAGGSPVAGAFAMDQFGDTGATSFFASGLLSPGTTYTLFMTLQARAFGFLGTGQSGDDFATLAGRLTFSAGPPAPVPLPAAAWLLLSGLGALGAAARRKHLPHAHA